MKWNKPTSSTPLVGNDVVDLTEPATRGKTGDVRFLARVCTAHERALIAAAPNPNLALWCLWAAKEAAYKIAKRRTPEIRFLKKRFEVQGLPKQGSSVVAYDRLRIPVRWVLNGEYVHCVAGWPPQKVILDEIFSAVARMDDPALSHTQLSDEEVHSARTPASRPVRQLAKRLLSACRLGEVEIIRPRLEGQWKGPRLRLGDRELTDAALSMSHHGRFVAAAVWCQEASKKPRSDLLERGYFLGL